MPAIEIKKNVFWVGVLDWNLRNFHGYSRSDRGTTYNAYLILDDKITLVDTVPFEFRMDLYHQIRGLVPLEKIDYIISNHMEPDHAGALDWIVERINPEKIFCSTMGKKILDDQFHGRQWPLEVVKTGDTLSLGKKTVRFMETRMLHWPDSMFSLLVEDRLLFSNDAFGQNIASSKIFDDEHDLEDLLRASSHYYANIILPFSNLVLKTLQAVADAKLDIDMIAPDHGVVWRSHVADILKAYGRFARQETAPKAVIAYDTMWKSTEKMAKAVAEGLLEKGVEARLMHLKSYHHSDIMGELADAKALVIGSPTHNNGMLPLVADLLTYVEGLRPQNRIGAAFGSYGWSGEAVKKISDWLSSAGFEVVEGVRAKYVPTHDALAQSKALGHSLAEKIKETSNQ
ncbi:MAG: FprA family A-type flavoprotein [Deltaproteobacteria bacterium]|nr:FprA family A-type flavoprotein [Deltaproteobacteria bacterium]